MTPLQRFDAGLIRTIEPAAAFLHRRYSPFAVLREVIAADLAATGVAILVLVMGHEQTEFFSVIVACLLAVSRVPTARSWVALSEVTRKKWDTILADRYRQLVLIDRARLFPLRLIGISVLSGLVLSILTDPTPVALILTLSTLTLVLSLYLACVIPTTSPRDQ